MRRLSLGIALLLATAGPLVSQSTESRPRARDIGLVVGQFQPGENNAITDVEGVRAKN